LLAPYINEQFPKPSERGHYCMRFIVISIILWDICEQSNVGHDD